MIRTRTGGFGGTVAALAAIALLAASSAGADIGRANLDGSGADRSFIATPCPDFKVSPCRGVAVDGEHIYWSSDYDEALDDAGAIGRANLDGSRVTRRFITAPDPEGVAVAGMHLYWASTFDASIWRANLDGSGVTPGFIPSSYPSGIAVDSGHIYWVAVPGEKFPSSIERANLDGSGVEDLIPHGANGLAVDASYIYWSSGAIGRANLDGSGVDGHFIPHQALGLAVDGEHIYWSNFHAGTIGRANLDGSDVDQEFISDAGCVTDLAVDGGHVYWSNEGRNVEGTCLDRAVTLTIKGKRLTLEGRHATVELAVPAEASPPVTGSLELRTRKRIRYRGERRRITLAEDSVRIASPPRTKSIELRLSKSKARLVRNDRKARRVRAIAWVSDQVGNDTRTAKRMRLRLSG